MTHEEAAMQNARVWARRLNLNVNIDQLSPALEQAGFKGSVLKGPLALLFYKKISMEWDSIGREDKRKLAKIASFTLSDVVRGDSDNVLASLGKHAQELDAARVYAQHSTALLMLINVALAARREEKTRPSLANAVLGKLPR